MLIRKDVREVVRQELRDLPAATAAAVWSFALEHKGLGEFHRPVTGWTTPSGKASLGRSPRSPAGSRPKRSPYARRGHRTPRRSSRELERLRAAEIVAVRKHGPLLTALALIGVISDAENPYYVCPRRSGAAVLGVGFGGEAGPKCPLSSNLTDVWVG